MSVSDYLVLGAGLAGTSLSLALCRAGRNVRLVDTAAVGSGASGTPGALVNLATGRRGTRVWRADRCLRAVRGNLEAASDHLEAGDPPFWRPTGVLRPALTPKMARKMREQYEKTQWDPSMCRWLDRGAVHERHPGISCVDGGLWLPAGMSVDSGAYLEALARLLCAEGAEVHEHVSYELRRENGVWIAEGEDGVGQAIRWKARRAVFAAGRAMVEHPLWNFLNLHPVKGQLALLETDQPLGFAHSVSSLGYLSNAGDNRHCVTGSTYEHDYNHLKPDQEGENYLRRRLRRALPELEARARTKGRWSGVRVSSPDRKPVLGAHPREKDLYCFTALGSKGLLYSAYLATCMSGWLEGIDKLPEAVHIRRMTEG
ncbi:MAG: FAD-dependent oxidoreductase [Balneolaceae bacterium]|nr:FAD-dependent oxidoreductase [Balneolaceae bacterium]